MGFEVVGLPHYVIWHVYEPSADDLIRMAEMEAEKQAREMDVEDPDISKARWDQDRQEIETALEKNRKAALKKQLKIESNEAEAELVAEIGGAEGPIAHVGEEDVPSDHGNGLTGLEVEKEREDAVVVENSKKQVKVV